MWRCNRRRWHRRIVKSIILQKKVNERIRQRHIYSYAAVNGTMKVRLSKPAVKTRFFSRDPRSKRYTHAHNGHVKFSSHWKEYAFERTWIKRKWNILGVSLVKAVRVRILEKEGIEDKMKYKKKGGVSIFFNCAVNFLRIRLLQLWFIRRDSSQEYRKNQPVKSSWVWADVTLVLVVL